GVVGGLRARDLDVQLSPLRIATLDGSGVRIPVGGSLTGSALVNGAVRDGWSVRGDLTHVEGSDRSRVIGTGRYETVGKRIVADATLRPLSLATVGRFAPEAALRGDVTGRVHAEGTTGDLRLSGALHSTSGGGSIDGRGTLALRGSRTRYDVAATLDALNAHAFSRRAPDTKLTGTISARGQGTSPATANAVVRADLVRSRYDTFSVDRLTARLATANGLLRADTLVIIAGGATARASGTLGLVAGRDGTMRATVSVDSLGALRHWLGADDTTYVVAAAGRQSALLATARADSARRADASRIERLALGLPPGEPLLVDTLPPIRRDSLAGALSAAATLRGNVKRLGVDATVHGRDLVVRGNAASRLDAKVSSPNVRDRSAPLAFTVSADSVQARGYGLESLEAVGTWRNRTLRADVRVRQDSFISYAALGSYARPASGVQVVRLDSLAARFDTLTWRLAHRGGARLDHGSIAVDSVDLRSSAGGRLFANGIVPAGGAVRLDVAAENVRIATVLMALQRTAQADGVLGATAHVSGTRDAPAIRGQVTVRDATYRGARAPDADADLRYEQRRLVLDATARDSTGRRVLVADASLPLDLSLRALTSSRRLAGPLAANLALDSLNLAALPLASRSLKDVRGSVAGEAQVRGTWRAPEYTGHAALRGGELSVVSTGMRLTDAIADLRIVGDTLRLDSLVARSRGALRASGTVNLADRAHPFVRLNVDARELRVMDAIRGLLDVDAEVAAVGPLEAVRVTGRVELLGGFLALKQFNKNLIRVKAPGSLTFFTVFDTTAPAADSVRRIAARERPPRVGVIADLSLVVDRGNYYRNRPDANTEFYTTSGQPLAAHIDTRTGDQYAVGFVRIGGGVAIFRASTFTPARGSLTFAPYTNGPGFLEQVGERPVWEPGRGLFPLHLLTGGTSKAPAIGLETGAPFPIRGRELNGYLTMGRDYTSLLQQSGSTLSGSEAWSGQLSGETGALARRQQAATALGVVLHDIGTGATKEFGLDAFSVSPTDLPTELVFGKTGGVRGAIIEGGSYVTVDRYIAGQLRPTSAIPGVRMSQLFGTFYRLDVGIEPRFLFRAPEDLGITHPTVRTGVFGAFLTRLWDW
ncbi:MAG: translocation/assembly module TamB domain-containing protein, partial [Gemmatimonadota bacterium]|nr:translocation/assembly module TamB domain-containing protein [Gemmatimonadota bacterium]